MGSSGVGGSGVGDSGVGGSGRHKDNTPTRRSINTINCRYTFILIILKQFPVEFDTDFYIPKLQLFRTDIE